MKRSRALREKRNYYETLAESARGAVCGTLSNGNGQQRAPIPSITACFVLTEFAAVAANETFSDFCCEYCSRSGPENAASAAQRASNE